MKNIFLELQNLSIGYQQNNSSKIIRQNIDLQATTGELIALIGTNGAGKSTLLRTIVNLQKPLSGKIFIKNNNLNNYTTSKLSEIISFVSTEIIEAPELKVFDLVALGRFPYTNWFGKLSESDNSMISNSLQAVGMTNFRQKYISQLSDGERQRVMIARTLAQNTPMIVLDEPTAFLDLNNKYEIVNLLHTLAKQFHKTIIFSTHDINIAIREADKIWLMLDNETIQGAPEDLILQEKFQLIFSEKNIFFDNESGDFRSQKHFYQNVQLSAFNNNTKLWTRRALERAGYNIVDSCPKLHICQTMLENKIVWQIMNHNFFSIYDLINFLNINKKEIS